MPVDRHVGGHEFSCAYFSSTLTWEHFPFCVPRLVRFFLLSSSRLALYSIILYSVSFLFWRAGQALIGLAAAIFDSFTNFFSNFQRENKIFIAFISVGPIRFFFWTSDSVGFHTIKVVHGVYILIGGSRSSTILCVLNTWILFASGSPFLHSDNGPLD